MPSWPWVDERAADRLLDVASQLDAGLDPRAMLGPDAACRSWEEAIAASLERERVRLSAFERALLQSAEHAGRLPQALRARAQARQQRAGLARELLRSGAYPLAVLSVAVLAASVSRVATPLALALLVLGFAAVLAGAARALLGGSGERVPLVRDLQHDRGEVVYLEALHDLYASGVPLREAHPRALAAVPVAWVRMRLFAADAALQRGEPLVASLAAANALREETLRILAPGERAGDLEAALARALQRRRDTLARNLGRLRRAASLLVTAFAFGVAVWVILAFYGGLFGSLGRAR
jgi:type II secretory pathway component PulF